MLHFEAAANAATRPVFSATFKMEEAASVGHEIVVVLSWQVLHGTVIVVICDPLLCSVLHERQMGGSYWALPQIAGWLDPGCGSALVGLGRRKAGMR